MIKFRGREIPETLEEILAPSHTALVIHDMQNAFSKPETIYSKYYGPVDAYRIVPKLQNLREAARKAGVFVMYSQYTEQPEWKSYSNFDLYKMREKIKDPANLPPLTSVYGTWGWEIIDELKPAEHEPRVFKYRLDTFIGTSFDNILRTNGIKTIVSCGIALEMGVLPTAITASFLDYYVVVPRDAASGSDKNLMDNAINQLEREVIVTEADKIIDVWKKNGKPT
jgi:ureidoacrylate peracid hydrolase